MLSAGLSPPKLSMNAVTGRPAFSGEDAGRTLTSVIWDEPARPKTLRRDLPDALELIIQRAMAKDPDKRFSSMAELDAALAPLGVKNLGPFGNDWRLYGKEKPALVVGKPGNGEPASSNGATVGFAAKSTADVDAFHKAGLANGGSDQGAPGARSHLPGAYAAYLTDPAGNKVCSYAFTE